MIEKGFIEEESARRWREVEERERKKYDAEFGNFPLSKFLGYSYGKKFFESRYANLFERFLSGVGENILVVAKTREEATTILDYLFSELNTRVVNVGDPCDFRDEGYIPWGYIDASRVLDFGEDKNNLLRVLGK